MILEEFKSLRSEELNKMDKQYQIIGLGTTGAGALAAVAFKENVYSLFIILPILIITIMGLYHIEKISIKNVGEYLLVLEDMYIKTKLEDKKIKLNGETLGWEKWINRPERCYIYAWSEIISTLSLFIIFFLCVYGMLTSSPKGFEFINGSQLKIASLYFLIGIVAFFKCNLDNLKALLSWKKSN